ncbi:MAG TPA: heat-inducible transcriptional repressor HrcA [Solirubrobacteraceae bacterium]|nr:heat-inducible transcriptional repressor HrcA [Solirubrobacteraceae bacterium]
MLTDRQELVLRALVEEYLDEGLPVGSKALAEAFEWGPSTIRSELANLEELGLLAHPHTSAGRVPTEAGYRYFVDRLLPDPAPGRQELSLSLVRHEIDEAMRATTEALSQVTNLLAIVTAPPIETSTIRHIEVLPLQPQVVMVVVITSTGGVSKRIFTFPAPVDRGLVDWAASYLDERLVGLGLGARMLHQRLFDPSLTSTERGFLAALAPVFTALEHSDETTMYVEGTARLLSAERQSDVSELNLLVETLERRVSMLGALRSALSDPAAGEREPLPALRGVSVRIGAENELPALRSVALVAAAYGLPRASAPNGVRPLGAVSVIGPLRMNYGAVIGAVRDAAQQLSTFVAEVYEER